jgi:phosphoglycolate phosphatase
MIRLAVLDLAGTTVRDDGVVEAAFVEAMADEGMAPGSERLSDALQTVRDTMGQSKIDVFRRLLDDGEKARRANRRFEEAYSRHVAAGGAEAIPGAVDAMARLRAAGIKVCLTTGFSPETRDGLLAALGWVGTADLVLSPADAGRGRPAPDMILTAVIRLAIDDVRHVAVAGDTTSDLLAGHRSGAAVVAGVLTGAHSRAVLEGVPHSHLLASVAELPDVVLHHGA